MPPFWLSDTRAATAIINVASLFPMTAKNTAYGNLSDAVMASGTTVSWSPTPVGFPSLSKTRNSVAQETTPPSQYTNTPGSVLTLGILKPSLKHLRGLAAQHHSCILYCIMAALIVVAIMLFCTQQRLKRSLNQMHVSETTKTGKILLLKQAGTTKDDEIKKLRSVNEAQNSEIRTLKTATEFEQDDGIVHGETNAAQASGNEARQYLGMTNKNEGTAGLRDKESSQSVNEDGAFDVPGGRLTEDQNQGILKDHIILELRRGHSKLEEQFRQLKQSLKVREDEVGESREKIGDMLTEIGEWEETVDSLTRDVRMLRGDMAQADARVTGIRSQMEALEESKHRELESLQAEYNKLEDERDYLQEDKDQLMREVENLKALSETLHTRRSGHEGATDDITASNAEQIGLSDSICYDGDERAALATTQLPLLNNELTECSVDSIPSQKSVEMNTEMVLGGNADMQVRQSVSENIGQDDVAEHALEVGDCNRNEGEEVSDQDRVAIWKQADSASTVNTSTNHLASGQNQVSPTFLSTPAPNVVPVKEDRITIVDSSTTALDQASPLQAAQDIEMTSVLQDGKLMQDNARRQARHPHIAAINEQLAESKAKYQNYERNVKFLGKPEPGEEGTPPSDTWIDALYLLQVEEPLQSAVQDGKEVISDHAESIRELEQELPPDEFAFIISNVRSRTVSTLSSLAAPSKAEDNEAQPFEHAAQTHTLHEDDSPSTARDHDMEDCMGTSTLSSPSKGAHGPGFEAVKKPEVAHDDLIEAEKTMFAVLSERCNKPLSQSMWAPGNEAQRPKVILPPTQDKKGPPRGPMAPPQSIQQGSQKPPRDPRLKPITKTNKPWNPRQGHQLGPFRSSIPNGNEKTRSQSYIPRAPAAQMPKDRQQGSQQGRQQHPPREGNAGQTMPKQGAKKKKDKSGAKPNSPRT